MSIHLLSCDTSCEFLAVLEYLYLNGELLVLFIGVYFAGIICSYIFIYVICYTTRYSSVDTKCFILLVSYENVL